MTSAAVGGQMPGGLPQRTRLVPITRRSEEPPAAEHKGMPVNTGIGPRLPAKSPASTLVPRWTSRSSRRLPIRKAPVVAEHLHSAWRNTCLIDAVAVVQVKTCAEHHLALRSKPIPLFIDGVLDQGRISVDQPSVGVG